MRGENRPTRTRFAEEKLPHRPLFFAGWRCAADSWACGASSPTPGPSARANEDLLFCCKGQTFRFLSASSVGPCCCAAFWRRDFASLCHRRARRASPTKEEDAAERKRRRSRSKGGGTRAKTAKAAYLNQRTSQVDGKTVREALQEEVLDTKGESVRYTRSDIHLQAERLELRAGSTGSSSSN